MRRARRTSAVRVSPVGVARACCADILVTLRRRPSTGPVHEPDGLTSAVGETAEPRTWGASRRAPPDEAARPSGHQGDRAATSTRRLLPHDGGKPRARRGPRRAAPQRKAARAAAPAARARRRLRPAARSADLRAVRSAAHRRGDPGRRTGAASSRRASTSCAATGPTRDPVADLCACCAEADRRASRLDQPRRVHPTDDVPPLPDLAELWARAASTARTPPSRRAARTPTSRPAEQRAVDVPPRACTGASTSITARAHRALPRAAAAGPADPARGPAAQRTRGH